MENKTTNKNVDNTDTNETNENLISITQEDLNKRIQSAEDKVRTKYSNDLKVLKDAHSAELQELNQKISELEKFRPIEKTDKEIELERREAELISKERAVKLREIGIDENFSRYIGKDVDIEELKTAFTTLIDKSVNDKITANGYKPFTAISGGTDVTDKDFRQMSYSERVRLYTESPELYKALSK